MALRLESDNPVTDAACKAATGKALSEWFAYLDGMDGLKIGRREINNHLYGMKLDPWWCTTIAVEYERARDVKKKDGLYEGYFICSTKTIAAPLSKVFEAWSDPTQFAKWFGDGVKAEFKEGGPYSTSNGVSGEFGRIRQDKDIRMTLGGAGMSQPAQIEAQFQDKGGGKTGLLVNSTRIQTRPEADGIRNEWAGALNRLKALCEG
jgi:uncharacterized protein YndB with AHSA1/START domain